MSDGSILDLRLEYKFHAGTVPCEVYGVHPRKGPTNAILEQEDADKFGELIDYYTWLHELDGHPDLCIDFSRVGFVSTNLISKLIGAHLRIRKGRGIEPGKAHIHIAGASPEFKELLDASKVSRYFVFHDSVKAYQDSMEIYCGEITHVEDLAHPDRNYRGNGRGNGSNGESLLVCA